MVSEMISPFIRSVQKGRIKHPTQMGFQISDWDKAYQNSQDDTPQGLELLKSGKWIYERLESVRKYLLKVDLTYYDKNKTLRLFVADLNIIVKTITETLKFPDENKTVAAPQLIQYKLKNELGGGMDPDSILAYSIDGARFPISVVSTTGGKTPYAKFNDDELIARIKTATLLGQYYDIMETLWLKFLWYGWELMDMGDHYRVIPTMDAWAENRAISDYRQSMVILEYTNNTIQLWRHSLTILDKKNYSKRPMISIEGSGKTKELTLKFSTEINDLPPNILISKIIAAESYYDGLVNEVLPKLKSVSLFRLVQAWEILHALAKTLMDRFPHICKFKNIQSVLQYAPSFDYANIFSLFQQSGFFSTEEIRDIIDFFTFNPSPRNEIWDAPLIKLEDHKYALVIGSPLYSNLLRTMERFMVRGNLDVFEKGTAFEESCRKDINEAITSNPVLSSSGVHPKNYLLRAQGKEEDIDIIFWVGNKIFIGEAKCLFYPADRMEFYNHYETIRNAISQIQRKCEFANLHKKQILNDLNLPVAVNFEIKSFVIVNSAFGAGFIYENTPITDPFILNLFLRQNTVKHMSVVGQEAPNNVKITDTVLYVTEKEASERLYDYLSRPPQLEIYKQHVQKKFYPIPQLDEEEKPSLIGDYEVILPFPELLPRTS